MPKLTTYEGITLDNRTACLVASDLAETRNETEALDQIRKRADEIGTFQARKRMRRALHLDINREPLPSFAWPGGYPLFYLCNDGGILCPDCMNSEIVQIDDSTRTRSRDGWNVAACDAHYEGPPLPCDHCGHEIESAYGDPEDQEDDQR